MGQTFAKDDFIGAANIIDNILSVTEVKEISLAAVMSFETVIAFTAGEGILIAGIGRAVTAIYAQGIITAATLQGIVADTGDEGVIPCAAIEGIIAVIAADRVIPGLTGDSIVTAGTGKGIITATAFNCQTCLINGIPGHRCTAVGKFKGFNAVTAVIPAVFY